MIPADDSAVDAVRKLIDVLREDPSLNRSVSKDPTALFVG